MAPLVLEGDTLGKRHQHYNKMVAEAIANVQSSVLSSISDGDLDIENMLKIDVASKTRNVNYILEVLKSEDMLYVSRAIKNNTWLITEEQYAHIVNPEYLHSGLFPQMSTKAINKLLLHIRLNLRDEKRVEAFYEYQNEHNPKNAVKWLQHCSLDFILKVVEKGAHNIPMHLFKRLCERSIKIFEVYIRRDQCNRYDVLQAASFLIYTHSEKFLDVIETLKTYGIPSIGPKLTDAIMKACPERIFNKFDYYINVIDMDTFVKHLKKEDIKDFLLKHAKIEHLKYHYTPFIKQMPREGRFDFIKKVFIDKDEPETLIRDAPCQAWRYWSAKAMSRADTESKNTYRWYQFASFDVAFPDLKKLIRTESSPSERNSILLVLLTCAGRNLQYLETLLQYYHDKHINEPFKLKIKFVNKLISRTYTHTFDEKLWNILDQLFHSMEVYIESENPVQTCIKSIIIHNVIRGKNVPKIIEKKFKFDSLKSFYSELNQNEKNAVFTYLYSLMQSNIQKRKITSETIYKETLTSLEKMLNLLNDWEKDLQDYPFVVHQIKELIRIKKDNSWNVSLSALYNIKKSWKKCMFQESVFLCPSEEVLLNALKHDPQLLVRSKSEVDALCCNDAVSLKRLLSKLRIYWPQSLACQWIDAYLGRLDKPGGHKALVVGLCILLPQKKLVDIILKFTPNESKINWSDADQHTLSIRKQIAKNMHLARPPAPVEAILQYAKGDYLQYAVVSLDGMLYNLSRVKYRQYFPMLLDAPVSLQKYGIRYAFNKIQLEDLTPLFAQVWKSTKNSSIRTVLFTQTFDLLCKEQNPTNYDEILQLLDMFIDNLTSDENKIIYKTLGKVKKVPLNARAKFYMKSYSFLKSLPAKANCENILRALESYSTEIMELLDADYVANVLLPPYKYFVNKINDNDNLEILSSFLLCVKEENTQINRYERVLAPFLEHSLPLWHDIREGEYHIKNITQNLLRTLAEDLKKYVFKKKMNIPYKMFSIIQLKLEEALPTQENYVMLTIWKLVVAFVKLLDENKHIYEGLKQIDETDTHAQDTFEKSWMEMKSTIAQLFGKVCLQFLKEDIDRHFPSVYLLFVDALEEIFHRHLSDMFYPEMERLELLKNILGCENILQSYLLVYKLLCENVYGDDSKEKLREIRKILYSHPSAELKMHYYQMFGQKPDKDIEKNE